MRKNIQIGFQSIILTTIIFIHQTVSAQNTQKYSFGLRFEPNINWLGIDNKRIQSTKIHADVNFGLFGNYHLSEKFYFTSGFNIINLSPTVKTGTSFLQHFQRTNDTAVVGSYQIQYRLRYFEIPLLITMNTREMHNKTYFAEAGLGMAFLLRAKADIDAANFKTFKNVNIQNPEDEDNYQLRDADNRNLILNQEIFPVRFSGIIGAGARFGVLINSYITTGIRYNSGLNNLFKEDKWKSSSNFMSLHVGFIF